MKKKSKSYNNKVLKVLLPVMFLLLLIGSILYKQIGANEETKTIQLNKEMEDSERVYSSTFLKIRISLPVDSKIEERLGMIRIFNNNSLIAIDRMGTNYPNIEDYLFDLKQKNSLEFKKQEWINEHMVKVVMDRAGGGEEYTYFIYPSQWVVFSISTTSPDLYDEVDMIAKSFEYLGE